MAESGHTDAPAIYSSSESGHMATNSDAADALGAEEGLQGTPPLDTRDRCKQVANNVLP